VVTSDQTALAGMPPGRYGDVVLDESGRAHIPSRGCLAGSTATMPACMNHLASLGWLNPDELVAVGFHNPLRLIGLHAGAVRSEARLAYDAARRRFSV
jgi:N-acetylglucosamine-6-phosphate deacetylase